MSEIKKAKFTYLFVFFIRIFKRLVEIAFQKANSTSNFVKLPLKKSVRPNMKQSTITYFFKRIFQLKIRIQVFLISYAIKSNSILDTKRIWFRVS